MVSLTYLWKKLCLALHCDAVNSWNKARYPPLFLAAQLHAARGRHAEAAELYRQALRKKPDEFDIVFNAANTFR